MPGVECSFNEKTTGTESPPNSNSIHCVGQPEKAVLLAGVSVHESPVHFDVPGVGVAGGGHHGEDPQVEEGTPALALAVLTKVWSLSSFKVSCQLLRIN